jgi:hypothetical protein
MCAVLLEVGSIIDGKEAADIFNTACSQVKLRGFGPRPTLNCATRILPV